MPKKQLNISAPWKILIKWLKNMTDKDKFIKDLLKAGYPEDRLEGILKEIAQEDSDKRHYHNLKGISSEIYAFNDLKILQNISLSPKDFILMAKTIDELLEKDKKREEDGFPRRIRLGKLIRPGRGKSKVIVVPTTTEPKFYHDDRVTSDEETSTGGTGEGEEGEIIGEAPAQPEQGEGEGYGAGQGEGAEHDVVSDAFDLGKVLTEKFQLPNLKDKGKKRSFTKFKYDLTDRNRGTGQILDKKATMKKMVQTNILLGNIRPKEHFNPEEMVLSPQDHVYRILSREKDFETQAIVFFLRDYSGSMYGDPTEVVSTQHLFIYSWLVYQYHNNVESRFILHDTEAKAVEDFHTYYRSQVAGGTRSAPAFKLMNKIIENENLAKDYNIYAFYGTDGDDWDTDGIDLISEITKTLTVINRLGITIAKNTYGGTQSKTTIESNIERSGLLTIKPELIKMDSFTATNASENRIIEGIRKLIE